MSLIVARKTETGVSLASDWRVTPSTESIRNPSYLTGALKIWIMRPNLCVAYAGNINTCQAALRAVYGFPFEYLSEHIEEVTRHLASVASDPNADAAFIVATVDSATGPMLWRVDESGSRETSATWIGDHQAFERYQEAFHASGATANTTRELSAKMSDAMDDVIDDPACTSVGELPIVVQGDDEKIFCYGGLFKLYAGREVRVKAGETTIASFQSVKEGAFGYNVMPGPDGVPVVAIHFPHADIGALFAPIILGDKPAIFREVSEGGLLECVYQWHHIVLNAGLAVVKDQDGVVWGLRNIGTDPLPHFPPLKDAGSDIEPGGETPS